MEFDCKANKAFQSINQQTSGIFSLMGLGKTALSVTFTVQFTTMWTFEEF